MYFLNSFYDHLRHFTAAAQRLSLSGEVKLGSMNAVLHVGDREVEFLAQFLVRNPDGSRTYSMQYCHDALGFAGWLPYFNKRWIEAYDKLAFKQRCATLKLPTPAWSVGAVAAGLGDFVVKSPGGSFGQGVRGPFPATGASAAELRPGEYAERFVPGQIGKAWYWNDGLVSVELRDPAIVTGNGCSSMAQLVRNVRRSADIESVRDFFRYRGLRWDDVPAAGHEVAVDFKYGSPFGRVEMESGNRLQELEGSSLLGQLNHWGQTFWSWVPEPIRTDVLYTVDFVLSEQGSVALLEMNCNPTVAPEAYDTIVAAAFVDIVAGGTTDHGEARPGEAWPVWAMTAAPPFQQAPPPTAPLSIACPVGSDPVVMR